MIPVALAGLLAGGLVAARRGAGGGAGLTASQRRVVAGGRLLPVVVAALALAGVAGLASVRQRQRWPVAVGVAFIGCAVAVAVVGPGLERQARARVGVTATGRGVGPAVYDRGPTPMAGAPLGQLEDALVTVPYGGLTNTNPPAPRLRDVRESVGAGGVLVEVEANVNDHPDPGLRRQGEWYDLATAARQLFQADPTTDTVDVTLWSHSIRVYQARLTRQAAAGTGQLTAEQLPQRWQEEYRSADW